MAKINRYLTFGIVLIVMSLLIIGCQPSQPAPKAPQQQQPAVSVPKPIEKAPDVVKPSQVMEEKAPITQIQTIGSEIEDTSKITAIDDTESTSELDNLDGFVERI